MKLLLKISSMIFATFFILATDYASASGIQPDYSRKIYLINETLDTKDVWITFKMADGKEVTQKVHVKPGGVAARKEIKWNAKEKTLTYVSWIKEAGKRCNNSRTTVYTGESTMSLQSPAVYAVKKGADGKINCTKSIVD